MQKTAKLHVSQEVADLVKVYCVLKGKKMTNFTNEVLEDALIDFKRILERMKEL